MSDYETRKTEQTKQIEKHLKASFPRSSRKHPPQAYRLNSASIRVRVVSEDFRGLSLVERERMILPILRELPEELQDEITMLLLLTPEEVGQSMLDMEFLSPSRSML